jgi:hypothetical protein
VTGGGKVTVEHEGGLDEAAEEAMLEEALGQVRGRKQGRGEAAA